MIIVNNSSHYPLIVHIEGIRKEPFSWIRWNNIPLWKTKVIDIMVDMQIMFQDNHVKIPCDEHCLFKVSIYKIYLGIPLLIHHRPMLPREIWNLQNIHVEHSVQRCQLCWVLFVSFITGILAHQFLVEVICNRIS